MPVWVGGGWCGDSFVNMLPAMVCRQYHLLIPIVYPQAMPIFIWMLNVSDIAVFQKYEEYQCRVFSARQKVCITCIICVQRFRPAAISIDLFHAMHFILCIPSLFSILCILFFAWFSMQCIQMILLYALYLTHCIPDILFYVSCFVLLVLCISFYV